MRDPNEDADAAHKLILTQTDKQTLLSLVDQKPLPDDCSLRIEENFAFFGQQIEALGRDVQPLCNGLAKLTVVDIALSRDQDNPQLIFESMNSTGRELSQADLIRNFILMGLDSQHQKQLYNDHWRPMEISFGQQAYAKHFDSFMRYYLTVKTGELPNIRKIYEVFKEYARTAQAAGDIDALVADIRKYSGYYCAMELRQERNTALAAAFQDLHDLKASVAYPFLLTIYDDYANGLLTAKELEEAVRLVESYIFRRVVCGIPTNSMNRTFEAFGKTLRKDRYFESIEANFLLMPSYRRFPDDQEFRNEIARRDLYNFPRRSYWLRRMENHDRKERVLLDEYTIEHIMPQNENLPKEWQAALGDNWQEVQKDLVHTLGNLTLTGYNAEYGDRPFTEKRDRKGGFRESPLRLNERLRHLDSWNADEIRARAEQMADKAIQVWVRPSLSDQRLDAYAPKPVESATAYTIDDHKYLADGLTTRTLFDRLRQEVLSLDPCVTEESWKLYVAYKAETNFVDVVPQAKGLRLTLNLQFHELNDPRHMAKDVTNLGRWGNGDAEVRLTDPGEIHYVMSLVRQAFERQMADGDATV